MHSPNHNKLLQSMHSHSLNVRGKTCTPKNLTLNTMNPTPTPAKAACTRRNPMNEAFSLWLRHWAVLHRIPDTSFSRKRTMAYPNGNAVTLPGAESRDFLTRALTPQMRAAVTLRKKTQGLR